MSESVSVNVNMDARLKYFFEKLTPKQRERILIAALEEHVEAKRILKKLFDNLWFT